jgi:hypothetical protein
MISRIATTLIDAERTHQTVRRSELLAVARPFYIISGKTSVDPEGRLNVGGRVSGLARTSLDKFPIRFGVVEGDFSCWNQQLTSLEGGPIQVGGDFHGMTNNLTTLQGSPKRVGGDFYVYENPLTSLEGLPQFVGKWISVTWNENLPLLRLLAFENVSLDGNQGLANIMHKHKSTDQSTLRRRMAACQKELIDAGFAGNARM